MRKFIKSFKFAKTGLRTVLKEERYFKTGIVVGILTIIGSFIFRLSYFEKAVIILCITIVIAAEIVNTAIEDLCDKIEPNQDPVIGKIKDVSSAFVLVTAIGVTIVGLIIFGNHFLDIFYS